ALTINARHAGEATTTATGKADAGDEQDTAAGIALAAGAVRDTTTARFGRSASVGGKADITATSQQSTTSTATAGAKGGKAENADAKGADKQKDAAVAAADKAAKDAGQRGKEEDAAKAPKAEAPDAAGDGSRAVSAAGAIALNVADSRTEAYLGGSLTAAEAVAVKAEADIDAKAIADASATVANTGADDDTGVGVAVAINVADVDVLASVAGVVTSQGLAVSASMLSDEGKHSFAAEATSGAGGGETSFAGSLAINVGGADTTARLNDTARVNQTGDAAVTVAAASNSDNQAVAKPADGASGAGSKTGVGTAVAVNVVDETTQAAAQGHAFVQGAGDVAITADSKSTIATTADSGAKAKTGDAVAPIFAVTVANLDTLATADGEGSLSGSGALRIAATHGGDAKTSAKGKATGTDSAVGIAVAVGIVHDNTRATFDREATFGGKADITASSTQAGATAATASTKGGAAKKADATDDKAVDKQKDGARGAADKIAAETGKRDSAEAGATPKAEVADKDGKAEGQSAVSAAGAVAANLSVSHTEASVDGKLTAGDALAVQSLADIDASATADGSAALGKPADDDQNDWGIGAAIAINVGDVQNRARIAGEATARSVSVAASMVADKDGKTGKHANAASATSGAGGGDVGVAGALAINFGSAMLEAVLAGDAKITQTGADGAVKVGAKSSSDNSATAKPKREADGRKTGIGASAAINVIDDTTRAAIQEQATVDAEGGIAVTADAKHAVKTTAEGGARATGDGGDAVVPVAAVTVAHLDTIAEANGDGAALKAGKDIAVTAKHAGTAETTATGNVSAPDVAFGASVAVGVVGDTTRALLDRDVEAGGAVNVTATNTQVDTAAATASAKGGKQDDKTDPEADPKGVDHQKDGERKTADHIAAQRDKRGSEDAPTKGKAEIADISGSKASTSGALAVAGAVAVNVADSDTRAATGAGRRLKAGKDVALQSQSRVDAKASADGSAVAKQDGGGSNDGVGVAVAINVADVKNRAAADGDIEAKGLSVATNSGAAEEEGGAAPAMGFEARAKSGAGADKVGIAGSVAINIVDVDNQASVAAAAKLNLKGGDLSVTSQLNTSAEAIAEPKDKVGSEAGTTGVGASVALNVIATDTTAHVEDGAAFAGSVANAKVAATGEHAVTTIAKNGAAAGKTGSGSGTGVGAAVAIAVVNHDKAAALGSGEGTLNATGTVDVSATHKHTALMTSDADGVGGEAGVGANVAVQILDDDIAATLSRSVTAGGSVGVTSTAQLASNLQARASAQGASKDAKSADQEAENQVKNNPNAEAGDKQVPKAQDGADTADAKADEQASLKAADVGVAAVVGLTSVNLKNTARVADGVHVKSGSGGVTVAAKTDADVTNQTRGYANNMATDANVGAAVAVTAADVAGRALVGNGALLEGRNVTVTAGNPSADGSSDFRTTAAASSGGKDEGWAGAAAVAVIHQATEARVGAGAQLQASEDLTVAAKSRVGQQTLAGGGALGSDKGVGAAFAVTVLDNDTLATVGDGAALDAPGATVVSADAAINPLLAQIDTTGKIPLVPESKYISSGAAGAGVSAGDVSVGGSVVVNVFDEVTQASLGANVAVNHRVVNAPAAQSVTVEARDHTSVVSAAGSLAATLKDGWAVTAGVDVGVFHKNTSATIGQGSDVDAQGRIAVRATSDEDLLSVAAAAGISNSIAAGGSASVQVVDTATTAMVGQAAKLDASAIDVLADGRIQALQTAGQLALGSDVGIGLSNTTLLHTDRVEAIVGDQAKLATRGANPDINIKADSAENLKAIAAAGTGSSSAGLAGSAVVNVLNETTRAGVGDGAAITTGINGDVNVLANDQADLLSIGGSVAVSAEASVGAGAAVTKLGKNTEARVGSGVNASVGGSLRVDAASQESIAAVAAAGTAAGQVAVAGSADVLLADVTVRAFIGDDPLDAKPSLGAGDVHARGSIAIAADDKLDATSIAGTLGAASGAAVGAAVSVPVITKKVGAFVGPGAKVTADGQEALEVATGDLLAEFKDGSNGADLATVAAIQPHKTPDAAALRFAPASTA
ncbi:MAG TPA: hypothetical protein VIN58_07160, partial [Roseateles sp.]